MEENNIEWLFLDEATRDLLKAQGFIVKNREVKIEVISEETENGFRTVKFNFNRDFLEAYLDVRYERGGNYQLTRDSKTKIGQV